MPTTEFATMFPIDLIHKLIEIILGDTITEALTRERNQRRQFAKKLLDLYETVGKYRESCLQLLGVIDREHSIVLSGRFTPGTVRRIQEIGNAMGNEVKHALTLFGHEVHRSLANLRPPSSTEAKHRSVLTIRGQDVVTAIDLLYDNELVAIHVIDIMCSHYVDEGEKVFYLPKTTLTDSRNLLKLQVEAVGSVASGETSHLEQRRAAHSLAAKVRSSLALISSDDLLRFCHTFKFEDREGFLALRSFLTQNIDEASALTATLAEHLRAEFEIDDLL